MADDKMSYNSVEAEYMNIANKNEWNKIYRKMNEDSASFSCTEARKLHNKPLNRYRDVSPYDHSRIILERCEKDYINANLVKMKKANRRYILTQGPLVFTVSHFWLMVWEQKSRAILMLNKIIEKNEIKCHLYWPQRIGEEHKMVLSDVKLTVELISEEDFSYFSTRVLRITDLESKNSREVFQFHYTTWPDFGVPSSPVAFLNFLKKVRALGALDSDVGPAIVHCSAGIGRSGTFCLVDSCLVIIEKYGFDNLNIQEILLELRKDRMGLIQTPDQLRFSYQAIIEGAKRLNPNWKEEEVMDESIYSVVAEDGEDDSPPPLPPRDESLGKAPARPLPAIPASASLGAITSYSNNCELPSPPERDSSASSVASSADDEDDESTTVQQPESIDTETVLRRRNRELADRLATMKKRAHDADRWHARKRSLYTPLTISFGCLLAGIAVYAYVRR